MARSLLALGLLALLAAGCGGTAGDGETADSGGAVLRGSTLRISGSTTVNPVVARAAEILRDERGLEITVDTQGGSSGGIAALGEGRAEVAMSSRPIDDGDRARYPETDFRPVQIGADAVAIAVSRDVWEGGVRALGRGEMQGIYEDRIESWSEVGGPDRRIVLFDKEPGRGTWEVFADWLYGEADDAPLMSHLEVGSNEEGRTKVASTPGGVTQLSAAWTDGETVFALAVEGPDGAAVAPTAETIADGSYPISRPLLVVTDGPPEGAAAELIDFLLSPRGQVLVEQAGYLPLGAVGEAGPTGDGE
ncbi:MAG: phosphate ABC transporter substrate-binding protein [Acidobacteriota bacterium]|jgi:phosphate transport system substrate-binding protein